MANDLKKLNKKEVAKKEPVLVKAFARSLRIAPRKLRLVAGLVRGMEATSALVQLEFTNKKGSEMVSKLIRSAIANAEHNFNVKDDMLVIKHISADSGSEMKRYFPRARGSAFVIRRKMSHLNLILEAVKGKKAKKKIVLPESVESKPKDTKEVEAVVKKPRATKKLTSEITKTSEATKANKIQQKRRMFNRKSGE